MKHDHKKRRVLARRVLLPLLCAYALVMCLLGYADLLCPDTLTVRCDAHLSAASRGEAVYADTVTRKLMLGPIPLKTVSVTAVTEKQLYPGGMLFGVRCATEGVLVVGLEPVSDGHCPAKDAGIRVGDVILSADGDHLADCRALSDAVEAHDPGDAVTLTVKRSGETFDVSVPVEQGADGVCRAGLWTRDTAAGIGTVTFIDPETGTFGGLGHGICDVETGTLLPLARGMTLGVSVGSIVRGAVGAPGELHGCFTGTRTGSLTNNTPLGVFGVFSTLPETYMEPLSVGPSDTVHAGDATLLCSLDDTGIHSYDIRILRLTDKAGDSSSKNFVIRVTDEALLQKTGGIVQGMSGSPIIQDGRLIGAVTHVLVDDPTKGYGIFIENMLDAAA